MQQVRMTDSVRLGLVLMGIVALVACPAWAQSEAELNAQIAPLIEKVVTDDDAKDIREAAVRLAQQYEAFGDDPNVQYQFALLAGDAIIGALDTINANRANDDLATLREVNLAMAGSQMDLVSSQDMLEVFIVHDNPAVRYYGWQGYGGIRTFLLAQGFGADTMMTSISARLVEEPSAEVVASLVKAMRLPTRRDPAIEMEDYQSTVVAFLAEIDKALPVLTTHVYTGEYDWTETAEVTLDAIGQLRLVQGEYVPDADMPDAFLQHVVDLLTVASEVYANAEADSRTFNAASGLMLAAEDLLNDVSNLQKTPIKTAMTDRTIATQAKRNTKVQLAAIEWASLLASQGVTETNLNDFAPADAPAEAPAEDADAGTAE